MLGDLAAVGHLDAAELALGELRRHAGPPSGRAASTGASTRALSAEIGGALTAKGAGAPSRTSMICSANCTATLTCASCGTGGQVRCRDHFRMAGQRIVGGRARLVDVQGGTGDGAPVEASSRSALVDDATPGAVHDPGGGLHLRELCAAAMHAIGLGVAGTWIVRKSELESRVGKSTRRTPMRWPLSPRRRGRSR